MEAADPIRRRVRRLVWLSIGLCVAGMLAAIATNSLLAGVGVYFYVMTLTCSRCGRLWWRATEAELRILPAWVRVWRGGATSFGRLLSPPNCQHCGMERSR